MAQKHSFCVIPDRCLANSFLDCLYPYYYKVLPNLCPVSALPQLKPLIHILSARTVSLLHFSSTSWRLLSCLASTFCRLRIFLSSFVLPQVSFFFFFFYVCVRRGSRYMLVKSEMTVKTTCDLHWLHVPDLRSSVDALLWQKYHWSTTQTVQNSGFLIEQIKLSSYKDSRLAILLRCWMFLPLGSLHSEKVPRKRQPSGRRFVIWLFVLLLETAEFLEHVFSSSWLPAAINLHSTSVMCLASELSRTSVRRTYPGQSGFNSDRITLVTVLSCLLPFSFCLSGWYPVGQMGIFTWRSTFLAFFWLGLRAWRFFCLAYLALSLRSFVSFLFACNAFSFKKPAAEEEKLLLATHWVSCTTHEWTPGGF